MSKNSILPIILGCYEEADKAVIWHKGKEESVMKLAIVRLKERAQRGDEVRPDQIENLLAELWFSDPDELRIFIGAAEKALRIWEGGDANVSHQ